MKKIILILFIIIPFSCFAEIKNASIYTFDKDTFSSDKRFDADVCSAIYKITKTNGELVGMYSGCIINLELEPLEYNLELFKPSIGYIYNAYKTRLDLLHNNNRSIDLRPSVIKKEIIINNYYIDNNGNNIGIKNVEFEVYYENKLINTIKTNDLGESKIELIYGKYRFHQTSEHEGFTKQDDFIVDISNSKSIYYLESTKIKSRLELIINNYEHNVLFNLYNKNLKTYFAIENDIKYINNLELPVGEYELEVLSNSEKYYVQKNHNLIINYGNNKYNIDFVETQSDDLVLEKIKDIPKEIDMPQTGEEINIICYIIPLLYIFRKRLQ